MACFLESWAMFYVGPGRNIPVLTPIGCFVFPVRALRSPGLRRVCFGLLAARSLHESLTARIRP